MVKDGEAWCGAVHVVTKSQTQVSDRTKTTTEQGTHAQKDLNSPVAFRERITKTGTYCIAQGTLLNIL